MSLEIPARLGDRFVLEQLAGSGGMQRLKEDLGARGSLAVEPARIHDVLIKEMLVQ